MKTTGDAGKKDNQRHDKRAVRKQEVITQGPKEDKETGLRKQADKQKYAGTSGGVTVYMDYQERPLRRKGRNVTLTILHYVGDSSDTGMV